MRKDFVFPFAFRSSVFFSDSLREMYARKGYELIKDLANGEKGQLQPFNVSKVFCFILWHIQLPIFCDNFIGQEVVWISSSVVGTIYVI